MCLYSALLTQLKPSSESVTSFDSYNPSMLSSSMEAAPVFIISSYHQLMSWLVPFHPSETNAFSIWCLTCVKHQGLPFVNLSNDVNACVSATLQSIASFFFPLCSLCVTHLLGQGCPSHYCTTAWAGLEALVFLWCLGKPLQLLLILVRPFPCAEGGAGCWERGKQMFWSFEFKAADLSKQGKGKRKTGLTDDIWAKPEVCDKPESVSLHSFYRQASHFLSMRNCCMPPVTLQSPSFVPFLLLCARASPSASLLLACKGFLQTLLSNLFKQKVLLFLHTSIVHTRLSSAPLC